MAIPSWQAYTGQTAEEARGFGWMNAIRVEDRPRVAEAWQKAFNTKGVYEVDYLLRTHDGSWRNILARGVPVLNIDGTVREYVGTCIDITAQKQAEVKLVESEFFFRQTLESIPGMVFTTRPDGYCDYQSRQWAQYTGVPVSEHLGDGWNRLLHPDDRPRAFAAWRAAVEGRAPYDLEYRVRRHDGLYEWFKVIGQPIRDSAGQIVRWFGVALNIEDLKRASEELQESESRFRQLFEDDLTGDFVADADGSIQLCNEAFAKMFGFSGREQAIGSNLRDRHTDEAEFTAFIELIKKNKAIADYEDERRRLDGSLISTINNIVGTFDAQGDLTGIKGSILDNTERKRAQQAQDELAQFFRLPLTLLLAADRDAISRRINANAWKHTLGYEEDELVNRSFLELIHPDDISATRREVEKLTLGNTVWAFSNRCRHKSGQYRSILWSAVYNEKNGLFYAAGQDITERVAAERELVEAHERLRMAKDTAKLGIYEWRPTTGEMIWDERMRELWGIALKDPINYEIFLASLHPEDRKRVQAAIARALDPSGSGEYDIEFRIIRGDSYIWVAATGHNEFENGQSLRFIGMVQDITNRKRAEEALRESEFFYRQTLESIPGMVFTARPDGYVDYQNRQWDDYTGVSLSDNMGDSWNKVLHPEDRSRALDAWCAAVEERVPYNIEYRVRRHDGRYEWFKGIGRPILDSAGHVVRWFGVAINIEELKRIEHELAAAKLSAESAKSVAESANRAKDHFLAVLSHELRTPLTPVVMGLSLLNDKLNLDPGMRETLDSIRSNVQMEVQLIDDLLDVTRIARGKVELNRGPVELCSIIHRAAEVCMPDIEARKIHFGVDLGHDAPYWIDADASRLQQVFWNLLKNAVKFTPHGGCVGVRVRSDDGQVNIEVNDSGIGIEAHALGRVFDAFEQAERSITRKFGGLGLGLAISKALVEIHNGKIEAHSKGRDKGATFRVRLPLISRVSPRQSAAQHPRIKAEVRPLRILLVEDHGVTAQMMKMVLTEKRENKVEIAGDIASALELADQQQFDLLLSDLGLPDGSGHDLIRKLRARGYHFPAIALSGYGQEDDIARSHEAGFVAHLTKPASREAVLDAVEAATSGDDYSSERYLNPNLQFPPLFDPEEALKQCYGDREALASLMNSFEGEFSDWLKHVWMACEKEDFAEIGRVTHRLKGTLLYLGSKPAAGIAARIEQAAKSGQATATRKAISELEHQVSLLKQVLHSYRKGFSK